MHLPTWDELIKEQKEVLETPLDQPLFVVGPPGSGKTVLAVQRAKSIAEANYRTTVVTYNRMLRRLVALLDGPRAATMQVLVGKDYHRRMGVNPPTLSHNSYAYDWNSILENLADYESVPTFDHLVIDEGQDLASEFFHYTEKHLAPVLTVFADFDQTLGSRHASAEEILEGTSLPNPIILSVNHRNRPEISEVAEHFHAGHLPAARAKRPASGERPRLIEDVSLPDACAQIATWFQNRGGNVGVVVSQNSTVQAATAQLRALLPDARVDLYTSDLKNEDEIELLSPGLTVLNCESVKGQEFDTLFLLELERFLPCRTARQKRTMYMLCARARDHLFVVSGKALSPAAQACLPSEDLLERS
ncbi:Part of AAA domain-containing protein [Myxococcus fulvus]|uniref:Part of AAA domain-containing protein n=1 Tax=Myxococcus fulvus TaxID=33 RepID=A0A511TK11_MYXFU|nr:AAA family ATPase [Myxococcus fulvus]GEN13558.1 hypothetical protein MFU01_85950 [Myxococcus fulvus]SET22629.1 Part of AAA domain-containing protein [Myxococcus fulvus]